MTSNYIISALVVIAFIYFIIRFFASEKKEKEELEKSLEDETLAKDTIDKEELAEIEKNNFRDIEYEDLDHAITKESNDYIEFIKASGGKPYRLTIDEEEDLLNNSLLKHFTGFNIAGVFKITETKLITLVETTFINFSEPLAKNGDTTTYSSNRISYPILTIKTINKEFNINDKMLFENLKSNSDIEFVKKSNNYYFKFNRQASKYDLSVLLGK
jgi:hypothetical protein